MIQSSWSSMGGIFQFLIRSLDVNVSRLTHRCQGKHLVSLLGTFLSCRGNMDRGFLANMHWPGLVMPSNARMAGVTGKERSAIPPRPKALILTRILQTDFVKGPGETIAIVEIDRTSALAIPLSSDFPKMWVRIRPKALGFLAAFLGDPTVISRCRTIG
jgi:hypothetical protein